MIKPEIGMPVVFHHLDLGSIAGQINRVWSDNCVDVVAWGVKHSSVLLHQGFDGQPNPTGSYWCQFPNWFVRMMNHLPAPFGGALTVYQTAVQPTSQVQG
jgi:hypothetical protein